MWKQLGLDWLTKKQEDALLNDMIEIVQEQTIDRVMAFLPSEEQNSLREAIVADDQPYLTGFLKKHSQTIKLFVDQEVNSLRHLLLPV